MTTDKMKHYLGYQVYDFITRQADRAQLERCKIMVQADINMLPNHEPIKFLRIVELRLINLMLGN